MREGELAKERMIVGVDVFYRVRPLGGAPYLGATRAWDAPMLMETMARAYAQAKDGPHVVEFLTKEEHDRERAKGRRRRGA